MVGKEYKKRQPREKDGTFTSEEIVKNTWKMKIIIFILFVIAFGTILARMILAVNAWSEKNVIKTQSPISFHKPIWVEPRPELIVLSPVVEWGTKEKVELNPIDEKIMELWGERYFLMAKSIFKCESGLKADAVNWGSGDVGIVQINFNTWKEPVYEEFGYTLVDLFDANKNLEVGYWIWDRADGVIGDGNGSFTPWTVYTNKTFTNCVE